jgi:hypothetical protein
VGERGSEGQQGGDEWATHGELLVRRVLSVSRQTPAKRCECYFTTLCSKKRASARPGFASQAIFTYSKSPGWPLMPMRGGAIQLAYWPGSTQGFISDWMNAPSASFGSQPPCCAAHCASLSSFAGRADAVAAELADAPVEALVRLREAEVDAGLLDHLVPAVDAALAVGDVVVEQPAVDGAQRRHVFVDQLAVDDARHAVGGVLQLVVVASAALR